MKNFTSYLDGKKFVKAQSSKGSLPISLQLELPISIVLVRTVETEYQKW